MNDTSLMASYGMPHASYMDPYASLMQGGGGSPGGPWGAPSQAPSGAWAGGGAPSQALQMPGGALSPGYGGYGGFGALSPYTMGMSGLNLGAFDWGSPFLGMGLAGNPYSMGPEGMTGGPDRWRNPYVKGSHGWVHPGNPEPQPSQVSPIGGANPSSGGGGGTLSAASDYNSSYWDALG